MKNWSRYLLEFIVIISSITLSFIVDECRDSKRDRTRNLKYLERIRNDLKADKEGLQILLSINNSAMTGSRKLLAVADGQTVNVDSIPTYVMFAMFHLPLQLRTANYESIKNSGVIYTFGDSLVNALIQHYDNNYQEIEYYRNEIREIEHSKIYPIVTGNYDLSSVELFSFREKTSPDRSFSRLIANRRLSNELLMTNFIRENLTRMSENALSGIDKLNELINKELGKEQ